MASRRSIALRSSNGLRAQISRVLFLILSSACASTVFMLFSLPGLHATEVTFFWDQPEDPNVIGYRVYYGPSSRNYHFNYDAGNNTTFTISNLQDATTYYFAVTAQYPEGESWFSNEIAYNSTEMCRYSISPAAQSIEFSGGAKTLNVSTQSGCTWTAVSNDSWLVITSNSSGTGKGSVNYSVNVNPNPSPRKGQLTVAGQTFTLTQKSSIYHTIDQKDSGP